MNTIISGYTVGAAKRTISLAGKMHPYLLSTFNIPATADFLGHPVPSVQRRAGAALALGTILAAPRASLVGELHVTTAEEHAIDLADSTEHARIEKFCQEGSCANCHGLEDLQPGTLDGKPVVVCVNCREVPAIVPAPLAAEYDEPDLMEKILAVEVDTTGIIVVEPAPQEVPAVEVTLVPLAIPDFTTIAAEYGEPDAGAVEVLFIAKGSDTAALKRSLNARRLNRAKQAKKLAGI